MVTQFALDLFKDPFFIGFNKEMARLSNVHREALHESYPPYDVTQHGEDEYIVTLAVAGFSKDDISVQVDNGTLIIKGEREIDEVTTNVIHKGIAARKFTRTFALSEYMEVSNASLENGLLNIFVERNVPEAKKPKTIKVK